MERCNSAPDASVPGVSEITLFFILAGKGFVLSGLAKEVKVLGHECREFLRIAAEVGQQPLNGGAEVGKGGVVGVAHDLLAQKLTEAFDQVQIR